MTDLEDRLYDPECDRRDVAVRALWLLFLRGKWGLLGEVGLNVREHGPALTTASDILPRHLNWLRVSTLLDYCPFLSIPAESLLELYRARTLPKEIQALVELLGARNANDAEL